MWFVPPDVERCGAAAPRIQQQTGGDKHSLWRCHRAASFFSVCQHQSGWSGHPLCQKALLMFECARGIFATDHQLSHTTPSEVESTSLFLLLCAFWTYNRLMFMFTALSDIFKYSFIHPYVFLYDAAERGKNCDCKQDVTFSWSICSSLSSLIAAGWCCRAGELECAVSNTDAPRWATPQPPRPENVRLEVRGQPQASALWARSGALHWCKYDITTIMVKLSQERVWVCQHVASVSCHHRWNAHSPVTLILLSCASLSWSPISWSCDQQICIWVCV